MERDQNHSEKMKLYFEYLDKELERSYSVAETARKKGLDPEDAVDVPLTKSLPERVESLIASVIPQLKNSGVSQRILELEKKWGAQSWITALTISQEIAEEKFCKFADKKEAMEAGIRTGFAYNTMGIVSAPLEGFVELRIKKRKDGKEYLAMVYAGPVRGAGGTAAAVSLLIADYVRMKMGYERYDADENEASRFYTELMDYHERVTNLQYKPSAEEIRFLSMNLPVEIDGDPTEEIEVSNFKDLPRIATNRIRGGVCLVLSMVALKGPKLWKEIPKLSKELGINWDFIKEFLAIQKKAKSQNAESSGKKITPDFTFISDLVAGRPVLSYPLRNGGFRMRYGRTRISGYSAASIHPNTMFVLERYVATGTQLKVERPGKAAAMTACDTIEPPIVKLKDGTVLRLEKDDKQTIEDVTEVLYLGDFLVCYGDFFDRAHPLVPVGYCEEWYSQELELGAQKKFSTTDPIILESKTNVSKECFEGLLHKPLRYKPSAEDSITISKELGIPLHPRHTYFFVTISNEDLTRLIYWLRSGKFIFGEKTLEKIILPYAPEKRIIELLGVPHKTVSEEFVILEKDEAQVLYFILRLGDDKIAEVLGENALDCVNAISPITIRDKAGTFLGARMGRPEKSKMRKLKGSPQTLFPVGNEGGRQRSVQVAIEAGKVKSSFPLFYCETCKKESIYRTCAFCSSKTQQMYSCKICGVTPREICAHGKGQKFSEREINAKSYFDAAIKSLKSKAYPDMIKGVRGTSNKEHVIENLAKGIIRARHDLFVNKDGTIRFDMSELPLTHFKPKEIGTSIPRLKELGYLKDIHGKELTEPNQVMEIFPQDVILPNGVEYTEESASNVMLRSCEFIDELLTDFYGLKKYYSVKNADDIAGLLVVGIAPHISCGIVGRIVGFSKTHSLFAHPLYHAAMRRDADGDEACVMLLMDALLNFSRQFLPDSRGSRTMDSPLVLSATIMPSEVDDMVHRMDVSWKYPLLLYEAAQQQKNPWEVNVELLGNRLNTYLQYEGMGYTHDVSDINDGVAMSAYKTLETMEDKLKGQMRIAEKVRAVDASDVARLVIEKHFIKDIKGNLRQFSTQSFRCVECNESYRRPPLRGKCVECNGKLLFTVSEKSTTKYLEPALSLAYHYNVDNYTKQTLEITRTRVEMVFGKEQEKQEGLGKWFG